MDNGEKEIICQEVLARKETLTRRQQELLLRNPHALAAIQNEYTLADLRRSDRNKNPNNGKYPLPGIPQSLVAEYGPDARDAYEIVSGFGEINQNLRLLESHEE